MLFSLIVANYNNGKYLVPLIESVRNQTYINWELIIVDDCSKDNSAEILEQFANDEKIKVYHHETNKGAAATFKTAVDMACGEIIGMLGADDALLPEALAVMTALHVQHPEVSIVCSNLYQCDERLQIMGNWNKYAQPEKWGSLIHDPSIGNFATFKKRAYDQTEGFDPRFKKALDHDIFLKLEEKGQVMYFDQPLYLYRANPIGISQNNNWFAATVYSIFARINAYERRLLINGIVNLTKKEYVQLVKLFFRRKALLARAKRKHGNWFFALAKAKLVPFINFKVKL